jgi:flagellar hook-basal body complex protein FliE
MGKSALARQLQKTQISVESFDDENAKTQEFKEDLDGSIEHVTATLEKAELEVETVVDDIEEIDATQLALESYADTLRASLANGGLSADAAAVLQIGLNHIGDRTGQTSTVSVEDFGGRMSRKQATTVSIEAISDKVKTMVDAAKEAFRVFLERLGEFWSDFVNGIDRLEASAQSLDKKIAALSEDKPATGEISFPGLAKLSAKGKVVGDSFDSINNELLFVTRTYPVNLVKSIKQATGLLQSAAGNLDNVKYMPFSNVIISALPDLTVANARHDGEQMVTRTLPGDAKIVCDHPSSIDDANSFAELGKTLPLFKIELVTAPVDAPSTYTVRSRQELTKFVRAVHGGIKMLQESSGTSRDEMAEALKAYNAQLEKLIAAVADDAEEGTTNKEHQDMLDVAQKVQRLFITLTSKGHSAMVSYMARTCGAMLALANKEASAYAGKEQASSDAEPATA